MPRPCKRRRVCQYPLYNEFIAIKSDNNEVVVLTIDELECLRLLDYEKMTQEQCAIKMMIARTTVTSIYQEARYKLMDAIVNGKKLLINGGNYNLCKENNNCKGYNCITKNIIIKERKDEIKMRIAVTYDNGFVYQHFGKTEQFKIYDVNEDKIIDSFILDSNGAGHGALADVLLRNKVDIIICGGIGKGAVIALENCNIKVCAGNSGEADEIVCKLIKHELDMNGESNCDHHHHDHDENHECHCGNNKGHHKDNNCGCH